MCGVANMSNLNRSLKIKTKTTLITSGAMFPKGNENVLIHKNGNDLIITPTESSWDAFFAMPRLVNEILVKRRQEVYENRKAF